MKLSLVCAISVRSALCKAEHFKSWDLLSGWTRHWESLPPLRFVSKIGRERRNKGKKRCRPHPQPLAQRRLYLHEEDGEESSGTRPRAGETDWHLGRQQMYISSLFSYCDKVKRWLNSLLGKKKGKKKGNESSKSYNPPPSKAQVYPPIPPLLIFPRSGSCQPFPFPYTIFCWDLTLLEH